MQQKEMAIRTRSKRAIAVPAIIAALTSPLGIGSAAAEEFSNTDVQFLYTTRSKADAVNGTGTKDDDLLPKGQLQAGIRLEHHRHRDYNRTSPFAMLKWVF